MPWGVRKRGTKYQTYNKTTGRVAGIHSTKVKAEKQRRLLEMIGHKKR